jgi:hypothetical protein
VRLPKSIEKVPMSFVFANGQNKTRHLTTGLNKSHPGAGAYFHFIHAFDNGRWSYAREPIAKRTVRLLSQYFFINVYVVLFLFNNVIYVFLLYDCMFMYDYPD